MYVHACTKRQMANSPRTATSVVMPPNAYRLGPSGRYAQAHQAGTFWYYSWSWTKNLQDCIDSTTGVVLAPEVQFYS